MELELVKINKVNNKCQKNLMIIIKKIKRKKIKTEDADAEKQIVKK